MMVEEPPGQDTTERTLAREIMAEYPPAHPDNSAHDATHDRADNSNEATESAATSAPTVTVEDDTRDDDAVSQSDREADDDLRISRNPLVRALWFGLGLLMTALGFIGAFLPVMPTTVFLLLAAFFFARSSPKFYRWLLNHPQFGGLIRDWRAGRGLTLRAKITAVSLIVVTVGSSTLFFVPSLIGKLILIAVGVSVSTYLVTRPTKPA